MKPRFFTAQTAFRSWLKEHHGKTRELWVGFYKKESGKGGITYPQALDEALCFGWIDGLRKSVGASSYTIRFTPRKADSIWSTIGSCARCVCHEWPSGAGRIAIGTCAAARTAA